MGKIVFEHCWSGKFLREGGNFWDWDLSGSRAYSPVEEIVKGGGTGEGTPQ